LAPLRAAIDRLLIAVQSIGARVNPRPVIILGNQKSGTSAIAALLAEFTGAPATLDLKREWRSPIIDGLKTGTLSMADFVRFHRLGFSRDIIKEPSLSPFYEELAEHFPQGKFVMVIRDPRDNIRSILNRFRIPGDLEQLNEKQFGQLPRAWQLIFDGGWLGLRGENYIEMLAQRWNYITDAYLSHKDGMLLCQYERFLTDKVGGISRLAEALDMPHRNDIADKVDVQYQPAGDRSVRWNEFFGDNLDRIERLCRDRMEAMGYAVQT
jgi:hypothetical protein